MHLGLVSLALGKEAAAAELFRAVAVVDPGRRLDEREHPPEVVAAYEAARNAVARGPHRDLTLAAQPSGLTITVNGRPATGTVRLPYGEHRARAATPFGATGPRLELDRRRALVSLSVAPGAGMALAAMRAAARRGDESTLGAAADAFAAATGARRVVLWDLRQQGGRVEASLRLRDAEAGAFSRQVVADLGAGEGLQAPIRRADPSGFAAHRAACRIGSGGSPAEPRSPPRAARPCSPREERRTATTAR